MATVRSRSQEFQAGSVLSDVTSSATQSANMIRIEARLSIQDLEALQDAFLDENDGDENMVSLNRDQFCKVMLVRLRKGTAEEFGELFDKIDVTKEGVMDWDKIVSHLLLEHYEKEDRIKATQLPQWKDLKTLPSPHKDVIQRVCYLKYSNRYIAISKNGIVSTWGPSLKLQKWIRTGTEACKTSDLWITAFVPLQNINKIALAFTSKEIIIFDVTSQLDFNAQYKIQGLELTPLSLDYWSNPDNFNDAVLSWGDTGGCVHSLRFGSATIALFERPQAPAGEKQETCQSIQLKRIAQDVYKYAKYFRHHGHSDWVRHLLYSPNLEGIISCSTTGKSTLVIGWMEKSASSQNMRVTPFEIVYGINAFDFHPKLNVLATAGVNHHVCLWNPYVFSKPIGVLRGHMASVVQVQFIRAKNQLISFSKDKVLRIWDVQLQICIQRLAGLFPRGDVHSALFFDDRYNRLFMTFNDLLTVLELKPEVKNRVVSHDATVVAALYNCNYSQVLSGSQNGTIVVWMLDTGQKLKQFTKAHGTAELTSMSWDSTETRFLTGGTDGTVKIWDMNGHCYHTLHCSEEGHPADVGQIFFLKRSILVVGWRRYITIFPLQTLRDFHVQPSNWKGGQEHREDILCLAFSLPNLLVSASYDGELICWNASSEQMSRRLSQRARKPTKLLTLNSVTREGSADVASAGTRREGGSARPKSRDLLKKSSGGNNETNEFSYAITRMAFLEARKPKSTTLTTGTAINSATSGVGGGGGGANLVTCGGNGWVRFWNLAYNRLVGEFVAHERVGSIIMAVDAAFDWLVTADVDGLVKVWEITNYLVDNPSPLVAPSSENETSFAVHGQPPALHCQYHGHVDMINSVTVLQRRQRTLILTASADFSVALYDIHGNAVGIFGQEERWRIDLLLRRDLDASDAKEGSEESDRITDSSVADQSLGGSDDRDQWEPDRRAFDDPTNYRINIWQNSCLGKQYQESRALKRTRRQPGTMPDLPYLHWERTGKPPAGPFASLETSDLTEVAQLEKPDFVLNPEKYFEEKVVAETSPVIPVPQSTDGLHSAFDERSLFPKYILEHEMKMKQQHAQLLQQEKQKGSRNVANDAAPEKLQAKKSSRSLRKESRKR